MIWRDSVKQNGLRFLSLYSTTRLDVTGEDSVLFYLAKGEVVQSIKCRGANNCGTRGFVKNNNFLMRDLFSTNTLKVEFFSLFQCEIK